MNLLQILSRWIVILDVACNGKRKLAALMSVDQEVSYHLVECQDKPKLVKKAKWHERNEGI